MFKLVLILSIPFLVKSWIVRSDGTPPICLSETNNACQEEMKQKNETLKTIPYYNPPLTDLYQNYTEQCRNVMECASGLECFKGKSQRDIFETSCDTVGKHWYNVDSCLYKIVMKIYSNDHNCTGRFSFENLFTADTIFKKEKHCILNIGQGVCKTDDFNFLQNNYDELIELYTNNPASDNDRWDHPSEKFYRMHCDTLQDDFVQKSMNIMVSSINQKNPDVQKVVEIAQTAEKCTQKYLLVQNDDLYYKMYKNVQPFVAVMTDIFKRRPRLLEYWCLTSFGWIEFFDGAMECMNGGDAKKCVLSSIRKYCQEEILADFEDLTVTMTPSKRSNVPDVSFSMFKNNQRHKFVFTVKNKLINF